MMTDTNPRPNPYVGPRAFQTGERLYGRDAELRELLDLLIAERIVLLHSPSGAGKSSLVQAGLIPLLADEGFEVLPLIRLNQEPPAGLGKDGQINRYTFSALLSLEASRSPEEQIPVEKLATLSLEEYLDSRPKPVSSEDDEDNDTQVLIFDQFEEVLTVDATDRESKLEFFARRAQLCATASDGRSSPCAKTTWLPSTHTCANYPPAWQTLTAWISSA